MLNAIINRDQTRFGGCSSIFVEVLTIFISNSLCMYACVLDSCPLEITYTVLYICSPRPLNQMAIILVIYVVRSNILKRKTPIKIEVNSELHEDKDEDEDDVSVPTLENQPKRYLINYNEGETYSSQGEEKYVNSDIRENSSEPSESQTTRGMGLRSKLNLSGTVPETNLGSKTSVDLSARARGREEEVNKTHFWTSSSLCFWSKAQRDEPRRSSVLTEDTSSLANLTTGRRKRVNSVQQQACESANCCWNDKTEECFHSIPSRHAYTNPSWEDEGGTVTGRKDLSPRLTNTPFNTKYFTQIHALITPVSKTRLQIIMSVPSARVAPVGSNVDLKDTDFNVTMYGPEFSFDVYRRGSNQSSPMITTTRGPNIASVNYWEIGVQCPRDGIVYGLEGRHTGSSSTTLDRWKSRSSRKTNLISIRALSGSYWDINILSGPTPKDVMDQLTKIIGKPKLTPYWSLGFHVCRDFSSNGMNLTSVNATEVLRVFSEFHDAAKDWKLPCESDCIHERLLNDLNFSASGQVLRSLSSAFDRLQKDGKKFLLSLSPQTVDLDEEFSILADTSYRYVGSYRGRNVSYPDFLNPKTSDWLKLQLNSLISSWTDLEKTLKGYVLIDNWPQDDSNYTRERIPYVPDSANGTLSEGTLWWTARQMSNTPHYEIHNKYGLLHARAVSSATGSPNDSLLLSASCYTGGGTVAGCLYQSTASWDSLSEAVEVALGQGLAARCYMGAACPPSDHPSHRLYQKVEEVVLEQQIASTGVAINGVPLPGGSSICGSDGNYTEELCLRWYSLGVVLPLMRVSSQLPLRDPLQLISKADIQSVKNSLLLRYSLLPYYYTLLREASQTGTPIIRPMFMEFPTDNRTWDLNQQFMVSLGFQQTVHGEDFNKPFMASLGFKPTVHGEARTSTNRSWRVWDFNQQVHGERPMFMEFPTDNRTWDLNQQFMFTASLGFQPTVHDEVRTSTNRSWRVWDSNQQFMVSLGPQPTVHVHDEVKTSTNRSWRVLDLNQQFMVRQGLQSTVNSETETLKTIHEVNAGKRYLFGHLCCVEDSRSIAAMIGRWALRIRALQSFERSQKFQLFIKNKL
uniref:Uncharacterized protein n=1 Tax=Timema cristinae TaxID=61476 RepID=A0A7R9CBF6_TIMCR|nr:unnamed protein product [Timema cristinae]